MRNVIKIFLLIAAVSLFSMQIFQFSVGAARLTLSASFERRILKPPPEAPFNLRFFTTAVKTDLPASRCGRSLPCARGLCPAKDRRRFTRHRAIGFKEQGVQGGLL